MKWILYDTTIDPTTCMSCLAGDLAERIAPMFGSESWLVDSGSFWPVWVGAVPGWCTPGWAPAGCWLVWRMGDAFAPSFCLLGLFSWSGPIISGHCASLVLWLGWLWYRHDWCRFTLLTQHWLALLTIDILIDVTFPILLRTGSLCLPCPGFLSLACCSLCSWGWSPGRWLRSPARSPGNCWLSCYCYWDQGSRKYFLSCIQIFLTSICLTECINIFSFKMRQIA
jgi:hypothetical protein